MSAVDDDWHVPSWCGLPATIMLERSHRGLVRLGPVPPPHPPLVDLLLRHGMPHQDRVRLSVWHELRHLQTLPLALACVIRLPRQRPGWSPSRRAWLGADLILPTMSLELASEAFAVGKAGQAYRQIYRRPPNPLPVVFRADTARLAGVGTILARRRGRSRWHAASEPSAEP